MPVTHSSWTEAEENAMAFWEGKIEDARIGENCFIGELPPQAYDAWAFAITGPAGPDFIQEIACRNMLANITGRYREREQIQYLEQQVQENLPVAGGTISRILRMAMFTEPSSERVTVELREGPRMFWQVTLPLWVAFSNVDAP